VNDTAGRRGRFNGLFQTLPRGIRDAPRANAADADRIDLGGNHDEGLACGASTPLARLFVARKGFVYLNDISRWWGRHRQKGGGWVR
jgi:hypothetical protein